MRACVPACVCVYMCVCVRVWLFGQEFYGRLLYLYRIIIYIIRLDGRCSTIIARRRTKRRCGTRDTWPGNTAYAEAACDRPSHTTQNITPSQRSHTVYTCTMDTNSRQKHRAATRKHTESAQLRVSVVIAVFEYPTQVLGCIADT